MAQALQSPALQAWSASPPSDYSKVDPAVTWFAGAGGLTANILGQTQQHLESTFQPIEDELMANMSWNNPGVLDSALSGTKSIVNSAYDNSRANTLGQIQQYGAAPTERQATALNRADNLGRSASIVDAANKIRIKMADRDRQLAAGGLNTAATQVSGG